MSETRPSTYGSTSAVQADGHLHTSADALLEQWAKRDRQYRERLEPLTEAETAAIRDRREHEARFVEPRRRGPLFVKARSFRAPTVGEWA